MTPAWLLALAGQSALVAGIALAGLWLLRHRSPLDRASWLKLALALLLALPLRPLLPRVEVTLPRAVAAWMAPPPAQPHVVAIPLTAQAVAPIAVKPHPTLPLLALVYALGVAGLMAHLALGVGLLARWSAAARPLRDERWQAALSSSGTPGMTLLLVSEHVRAPLSWGLRRPVILIDLASAARDHDAPAILAHEAAHIARGDWLTLMAARAVLAVFWFNPLIWVLVRALVQQCEEAADARALAHCEPTSYAQTLMTCLAGRGRAHQIPANGMAAGHGLSRRVHQVLETRPGDLLHRSRGMLLGLSAVPVLALAASGISFARAQDPLPAPRATRIVHADGSVETRHTAPDGQLTIRVTSKDGHSVWTQRYSADKAGTKPPAPPAPPIAPVPPIPPVPPVPPVPPLPPASMSDAAADRAEALAEAARERTEALAEGRAEAARARVEAAQDRAEALAEAARERTEALNEARQARAEARAQAAQARAEAKAQAWAMPHSDND